MHVTFFYLFGCNMVCSYNAQIRIWAWHGPELTRSRERVIDLEGIEWKNCDTDREGAISDGIIWKNCKIRTRFGERSNQIEKIHLRATRTAYEIIDKNNFNFCNWKKSEWKKNVLAYISKNIHRMVAQL